MICRAGPRDASGARWRALSQRLGLAYWLPVMLVLASALVLRSYDPSVTQLLRLTAFDEFQRLRPHIYDPGLPVRIVDIDEASLAAHGQWPWPRTDLAELVDRLDRLGAVAIAFDMVFPEPDRLSPREFAEHLPKRAEFAAITRALKHVPSNDQTFAAAIARTAVVLGFVGVGDRRAGSQPPRVAEIEHVGDDPRLFVPDFPAAISNLPQLTSKLYGSGSINWVPEQDMIVRRLPVLVRVGDDLQPSLAAEALRLAQGVSNYLVVASGAPGEADAGRHTGIMRVLIGNAVVPTDARGQIWLRFTHADPRRYIPAHKVLDGSVAPDDIKGRIVVIGTSAAGLQDVRATPLDPAIPGVEVQAQAIEQMLSGHHLSRPDYATGAELVLIAAMGAVLAILIHRAGAMIALAMALATITTVLAAAWFAFDIYSVLLDPVFPSLTLVVVYVAGASVRHALTDAERRRVRTAFAHYMAPALVERLASDPAQLRLGGESRELTLMFCDVRGFTSRAEGLDPQALTSFVNELFTPVSGTIMRHGGTIDKYMGDAVMAFWNAPVADAAHAANACRAALAILRDLEGLNAGWAARAGATGTTAEPVGLGIGLNTGVCCVGNFGSTERFDYSVIGDDVNLASRLEGTTKLYGVPIVIGEHTAAQVPDMALLELDLIRVRGRTQPVSVFALMGDEQRSREPHFVTLRDGMRRMLSAYRSRRFEHASELLGELARAGEPTLSLLWDLYDTRIGDAIRSPPPDTWDGSASARTK